MTHKPATAQECLALIETYRHLKLEGVENNTLLTIKLQLANSVANACEAFIKAVHKEGGAK